MNDWGAHQPVRAIPHLLSGYDIITSSAPYFPMSMFVVWSVHHVYIAHYVCLYTSGLFPPSLLALGWSWFSTHNLTMPKFLWVEAFSTVTCIRDRTPTKALDGCTRYDLLYDVKPDLATCERSARRVIVGPSQKLKKRAWTIVWATSISGAHAMHVHGGCLAELSHSGRTLRILSTSANQCYSKSNCTHFKACWIPYKRVHGSVGGRSPTS